MNIAERNSARPHTILNDAYIPSASQRSHAIERLVLLYTRSYDGTPSGCATLVATTPPTTYGPSQLPAQL